MLAAKWGPSVAILNSCSHPIQGVRVNVHPLLGNDDPVSPLVFGLLDIVRSHRGKDVDGRAGDIVQISSMGDIGGQFDHIPFLDPIKLPIDHLIHVAVYHNHDLLGFVSVPGKD